MPAKGTKTLFRTSGTVSKILEGKTTQKGKEGPETTEVITYTIVNSDKKFPKVALKVLDKIEGVGYGSDLTITLTSDQANLEDFSE